MRKRVDNNFAKKHFMAAKAREHHYEMENRYRQETAKSIRDSVVYGGDQREPENIAEVRIPDVYLLNTDSVSALFDNFRDDKKICVLNFASYKNPGGMFLEGSSAQEEALCHESNLYEILSSSSLSGYYAWNNQNKNRSLYKNRAIYIPDVMFRRDDKEVKADVLTCAAPNIGAALRYKMADEEENISEIIDRIQFMSNILNEQKVNIFIAGAWGCGVFRQYPNEICNAFYGTKYGESLEKVIHPIPGENGNYEQFKRIVLREGGNVL